VSKLSRGQMSAHQTANHCLVLSPLLTRCLALAACVLTLPCMQVYARGNSSPLTEYFVWPRKDAWEELKLALEARQWISDLDKVRHAVLCGGCVLACNACALWWMCAGLQWLS
jgi:hypothetical protein